MKGNRIFISMHKPPPIEPFRFHCFHRNSENFLELMSQFKDKVEYVFSGHIHGYSETIYDDNIYVVSGGTGAELVGDRKNITGKYNYLFVNVTGKKVKHKVYFPDI